MSWYVKLMLFQVELFKLVRDYITNGVNMFPRFLVASLLVVLAAMLNGCSVNMASTLSDPTADIARIKTIYVKKREGDARDVDLVIAKKAKDFGFSVVAGNVPAQPVDAILTYHDRWMWDITMYMLDLSVLVRDPDSDYILASGYSLHTSLSRKSKEEMAEEVLMSIFNKKEVKNEK